MLLKPQIVFVNFEVLSCLSELYHDRIEEVNLGIIMNDW